MAKILYVLLVVVAAVLGASSIGFADAAQQQQQRSTNARLTAPRQRLRTRYLARQEVAAPPVDEAPAPAYVTPYPSADELKPEIPFEEAIAGVPAAPDAVYGPPELANNQPDEIYGPPEVSENGLPAVEEPAAEPFPAPLDAQSARLRAARRTAQLRQRKTAAAAAAYRQSGAARTLARPAKLRSAPVANRRFA